MLGEHDDAELHAALRASGLYALSDGPGATTVPAPTATTEGVSAPEAAVAASTKDCLTLDSAIAAGGANLSQGQRQIIGAHLFFLEYLAYLMIHSPRPCHGTTEQAAHPR
jgi:ABC-type multidrug transport system fused ATPase/permease subunit